MLIYDDNIILLHYYAKHRAKKHKFVFDFLINCLTLKSDNHNLS